MIGGKSILPKRLYCVGFTTKVFYPKLKGNFVQIVGKKLNPVNRARLEMLLSEALMLRSCFSKSTFARNTT